MQGWHIPPAYDGEKRYTISTPAIMGLVGKTPCGLQGNAGAADSSEICTTQQRIHDFRNRDTYDRHSCLTTPLDHILSSCVTGLVNARKRARALHTPWNEKSPSDSSCSVSSSSSASRPTATDASESLRRPSRASMVSSRVKTEELLLAVVLVGDVAKL